MPEEVVLATVLLVECICPVSKTRSGGIRERELVNSSCVAGRVPHSGGAEMQWVAKTS